MPYSRCPSCGLTSYSAAGYSTGGTLISAFAAYIIINHQSMSVPLTLPWVFFIAVLGVTMAIPMKRQMINIEQLRFPSGIAAAETLRALHAESSQGLRAAKAWPRRGRCRHRQALGGGAVGDRPEPRTFFKRRASDGPADPYKAGCAGWYGWCSPAPYPHSADARPAACALRAASFSEMSPRAYHSNSLAISDAIAGSVAMTFLPSAPVILR